ncbi:BREX-1 system phosphatase PglZ type A [Parathalassolituus penaei]|uniref:BREX-1 system phosphatase PglZ type A n=1 Tax=Parathalassolituus penaei TaxID=2997323 RepID=A0A9X3EH82_9GAMM|nr:BREX-1 system phosphatase PglZ type A [Parathalassolituus penaei]MCY0967155.1 BREX-1 system phosphatase PglZ type A [Parathalassolituus penaei]
MNDQIQRALIRQFDKHRIVFWYDAKDELRAEFDALQLDGVEKVEIANNEYGLKYRMLREQPEQKFLLYKAAPQPDDIQNWLLDVQLAHGTFRTDQVGIWMSELDLGIGFQSIVAEHVEFYKSAKRLELLKKQIQRDDTEHMVRRRMLAICVGGDARIDSVLEHLLQEYSEKSDDAIKLVERCGLAEFLWEQVKQHYGYHSATPGIKDFVIELFKSCYAMLLLNTGAEVRLNNDALVFLKRWKDSRQFETSFEAISAECADILSIERDLSTRDFKALVELDFFRVVDQKIISDMVHAVTQRTVSTGDVAVWVRQRRQTHWYRSFEHCYEAIDYAARFVYSLAGMSLQMDSLADAVERYKNSWFKLDQLYRKFIYHSVKSGQTTLLSELNTQIENLYSNSYLLKLGDLFSHQVASTERWQASPVIRQSQFYRHWVKPFIEKGTKVCVVISDAMRYEIGDELQRAIRKEDRFDCDLNPMLSALPSYTQLGMASLLPHTSLEISSNDTGTVLVDGVSSQGTANRSKILAAALSGRGQAIKAEEFSALNRDASRELIKANDVLYVYHNRIDHTGDKMHSEGEAFDAAERTLEDLLKLVKKLTAANVSNILVTADHGFIYQNRELDESDFINDEVSGQSVLYRDRRFVLGQGLRDSENCHSFSSEQLGLSGYMEVQIPKSINRLRLKGSGSRFVHGGATLQEVVVPVLKINKGRKSDTAAVEVEIINTGSNLITSGQLAVSLYQTEAVTEKLQPRLIRVGIYTKGGTLISDQHEVLFDFVSENAREREFTVRFLMGREADKANNEVVTLRLDEKLEGTSHYREGYRTAAYTVRRSFTSDFDF